MKAWALRICSRVLRLRRAPGLEKLVDSTQLPFEIGYAAVAVYSDGRHNLASRCLLVGVDT